MKFEDSCYEVQPKIYKQGSLRITGNDIVRYVNVNCNFMKHTVPKSLSCIVSEIQWDIGLQELSSSWEGRLWPQ